jgi:small subunit ribosomal protein S2
VHGAACVAGPAGSGRSLRASDPPLESEDASVHLRRAQRHLHHRSPEDPAADRGGAGAAARSRAARRGRAVRLHEEAVKAIIQADAERCGGFHITERWLGGTLTNFQTIRKQIKRLKDLEQGSAEGDFQHYTKKEQLLFDRERHKLDRNLAGIKQMGRLPGALFVVDAKKERIAVAEANKLGIPVVAIVHERGPHVITVPIPGNDDAIRAVSLIASAVADVISEARHQAPLREAGEEGEGVTYSTETGVEAEGEGERRKRPAGRRKRRPKPEAIAARLKSEEAPAPAEGSAASEA